MTICLNVNSKVGLSLKIAWLLECFNHFRNSHGRTKLLHRVLQTPPLWDSDTTRNISQLILDALTSSNQKSFLFLKCFDQSLCFYFVNSVFLVVWGPGKPPESVAQFPNCKKMVTALSLPSKTTMPLILKLLLIFCVTLSPL